VRGKYESWPHFMAAYVYRQWVRQRIRGLISWSPLEHPQPGCTAVIGMCHRLPDVLLANLRCLDDVKWPELREVIITVDAVAGCLPADFEQQARASFARSEVRFCYYDEAQAKLTEQLRLPYVFSWLSWAIALSHTRTQVALLHDYDALILDNSLPARYREFARTGAAMQGIRWYEGNGVTADDRLATTFEAFLDVAWLRSFRPIEMFNQIGVVKGVSRDYDTLLEIQHRHTPSARRAVVGMSEASLVHPSQMVHQYTMFRKRPGADLPSFSIPMIPFFAFLSGRLDALAAAAARLRQARSRALDFLGDDTLINFAQLDTGCVDWALKQMVRVCVHRKIPPLGDLYDYGAALYTLARTPPAQLWKGDFTSEQRQWIDQAQLAASHSTQELA
jgi:hypothetical protein